MKLDSRSVERFLRDPGATRGVLLYGEDEGLVRARAATLVRVVVGQADDPFRVADLARDTHGGVKAEMTALSLTGGRRVVRLREAADSLTSALLAALEGPGEALLIVEAGALQTKSKLRALFEQRSDVVAIACQREEGRTLEETIRSVLGAREVSVDAQALAWLSGQLGADHGVTRQELEKLALFIGPGGVVDADAAMQCVGDVAGLQLDDALLAAISGDIAAADRALELALAEGATPVGVLRMALMQMQNLQRVRAIVDAGATVSDAVRSARPPVFGRRVGPFTTAVRQWSAASLAGACGFLATAERECKRTGSPAEVLCRNAVMSLARRASAS
jgi:DNA polymerase-3 subunit delta